MDNYLTIICHEPSGPILRKVRQLRPFPEEALRVYDQLKLCLNMFERSDPWSLERLIAEYWKFFLVDDVGLLCFDPFTVGKAHVHVTFWDRRLRGREELCRTTALALMKLNNVDLVLTAIPQSLRVVRAFAKRVGFRPFQVIGDREVFVANAGCFTMKHSGVQ